MAVMSLDYNAGSLCLGNGSRSNVYRAVILELLAFLKELLDFIALLLRHPLENDDRRTKRNDRDKRDKGHSVPPLVWKAPAKS